MAARKGLTHGDQMLGSAQEARTDVLSGPSLDAERVASRLALVAGASPGAFYLVAAIIEGILSVVPSAEADEKVH